MTPGRIRDVGRCAEETAESSPAEIGALTLPLERLAAL